MGTRTLQAMLTDWLHLVIYLTNSKVCLQETLSNWKKAILEKFSHTTLNSATTGCLDIFVYTSGFKMYIFN